MSQLQVPKTVTGGCLCGGVRYRIDFAPDHDWKAGVSSPKASTIHVSNLAYNCWDEASQLRDIPSRTRANAPNAGRTVVASSTTSIP